MAKEVRRRTDTDAAVERFLKEVPLSMNHVISYKVSRGVNDMPTIELVMFFEEPAPRADVTSIDKEVREYLPTVPNQEE